MTNGIYLQHLFMLMSVYDLRSSKCFRSCTDQYASCFYTRDNNVWGRKVFTVQHGKVMPCRFRLQPVLDNLIVSVSSYAMYIYGVIPKSVCIQVSKSCILRFLLYLSCFRVSFNRTENKLYLMLKRMGNLLVLFRRSSAVRYYILNVFLLLPNDFC